MSEVVADGPTAGVLLRRAREAAGLHVASLAVSLKVPVRKLEALEADRWDELPDAVFARALALSVCRTLKVDSQPILERLPQGAAPRLVPEREAINAPFRAPGDPTAPGWQAQLTRPVFLVVFALLLGALILIFLPNLRREEVASAKPEVAPPSAMVKPALVEPPPAVVDTAATSQQSTSVPAAAAPATTVDVPAPAATAAVAAASAPAAKASAAPAATGGVVVFKTQGPSWIEVTDSKGTVALRRLMTAGETAGASGNLPLAVTVGSVNTTSVEVRGKPFDLGPVSRDNVARFEVK